MQCLNSLLSEKRDIFFVPLWIHQPNYYEQLQLRQTASTTFQLMLYWKHLGLHVSTPALPSSHIFPLPVFKQARWKKNRVQQTSRSPPWGMENGLTLHMAQQKLILLCLFSPYWAAESVPDRKQLMVTSGFVSRCGLMFSSSRMVQMFTQNQHGLWMLLLMKIRGFCGIFYSHLAWSPQRLLETQKNSWSTARPGKGVPYFPEGRLEWRGSWSLLPSNKRQNERNWSQVAPR